MDKHIRTVLLALCALSASLSFLNLSQRSFNQISHPASMPLHSLSAQFEGLQEMFANVPRAGYYSDKNMDIPLAIAQFEQAQYMLAPTVLELNNTALPFIIFDCTSPQVAVEKIKELKLIPLSASNTGIILAAQPGFHP